MEEKVTESGDADGGWDIYTFVKIQSGEISFISGEQEVAEFVWVSQGKPGAARPHNTHAGHTLHH